MLYKNDLSKVDTFDYEGGTETRLVPTKSGYLPARRTIIEPRETKIILHDRAIKGPIGITCHLCGEQYRGNNYDLHLKACHRRRGTSKE